MKRMLLLTLALLLCLSLCACGEGADNNPTPPNQSTPDAPTQSTPEDPTQSEPDASHQHSYASTVTPPTCTEAGYTTYTCACGDSYTADQVDAVDHDYQEAVRVDATSHEDGSVTYTCTGCGDSYDEVLYATGSMGLEYQNNGDGTCTLVGFGTCLNPHVVIPRYHNGALVTRIGEGAFRDCHSLTTLEIPDSVTQIDVRRFGIATA